eukprot:g8536.t1
MHVRCEFFDVLVYSWIWLNESVVAFLQNTRRRIEKATASRSGSPRSRSAVQVVWGFREDALQLQGSKAIAWNVLALAQPPQLGEAAAVLHWKAYAACLRQTREEPIVVTTPEEYAEAWRGAARLVEVEAAASAVEEGLGRHLTDVWVDWEESVTYGRFEVKAALLFAHKIKFRSAMPLGEWGSSWLCVRRHLKGGGVPWHGHGAVIKASFDEKAEVQCSQNARFSVRSMVVSRGASIARSGENGLASGYAPPVNGFYLLELIPKALAESCMALALEELPHCPLVQRLVLAGPSDERSLAPAPEVVEVAALLDSLNDSQRRAVHYALRHPLAQVQGPPGTGKTMTTAVLATCFAWQNMSSGENRAVLLCTPTNRAADCAASFVARVCRRYAERRLEARSAEGTQCAVCLGGKPNTITLCGHPFHQSCLAQALELGSRCPICRRRSLAAFGDSNEEFPVPKRNEHAGLEARKVFEVPEELRRFSLHWRCHGASDDEHCTAEARKTRKAYRASVMNSGEGANGAAKNRSNLPFLVRANGVSRGRGRREMIQHGTKGPRADQLRRTYQQALQEARKAELREADIVFSTCVSCRRMAIAQALSEAPNSDRSMPLIFWQTSLEGPGERVSHLRTVDNSAGSRLNETEAQQAVDLASALASACGPGVGILCWYRAQVARVEQLLREKSLSQLHVATAQGSEWDYVILSTVRRGGASMQGRILADGHILNVALTRARRGLVVLGDSATLSTDPNWKAFLDHCRQQALWSDAWQRALVPGFKVELCQLQSQPELNGKIGASVVAGSFGGAIAPLADEEDVNGLEEGQTPLGLACKKGNPLLVKKLIEVNADVNMKTGPHRKKELPLGIAAYADKWDVHVVQALLDAKAKADAVDDYGKTALLYASERQRSSIVEALKKAVAQEPQLAPSPGATKGKPAFGGLNALVAAEQPRSGVEFSTTLRFAAQQLQPQVTRCGKEVTVVDRSSPCHGMKGIVRSRGGAGDGVGGTLMV